mmetsp:Transcript_4090/g.11498  ORF Transcript_4090/g.11498 Transcript_4090/m.11498 type:complete len:204 (-) Transcript_4090:203-814(-)
MCRPSRSVRRVAADAPVLQARAKALVSSATCPLAECPVAYQRIRHRSNLGWTTSAWPRETATCGRRPKTVPPHGFVGDDATGFEFAVALSCLCREDCCHVPSRAHQHRDHLDRKLDQHRDQRRDPNRDQHHDLHHDQVDQRRGRRDRRPDLQRATPHRSAAPCHHRQVVRSPVGWHSPAPWGFPPGPSFVDHDRRCSRASHRS